jgi:hypothetical protein
MVAALLFLLVPLRSLTVSRPAPTAAPEAPATKASAVHLRLTSTAVPLSFSVSHLGKVIWRGDASTSPVESVVEMPFSTEGVDLVVDAKWSFGQTAAVKLEVARGDDEPSAQTVWGDGAVSEVLTFK